MEYAGAAHRLPPVLRHRLGERSAGLAGHGLLGNPDSYTSIPFIIFLTELSFPGISVVWVDEVFLCMSAIWLGSCIRRILCQLQKRPKLRWEGQRKSVQRTVEK